MSVVGQLVPSGEKLLPCLAYAKVVFLAYRIELKAVTGAVKKLQKQSENCK